jgi:hypothetical protein
MLRHAPERHAMMSFATRAPLRHSYASYFHYGSFHFIFSCRMPGYAFSAAATPAIGFRQALMPFSLLLSQPPSAIINVRR